MKVGVIIYHSNILILYKQWWVEKCIESIMKQTFQDFQIYELCYSLQKYQLIKDSIYHHRILKNHVQAMNMILDKAFEQCDVVFNVNLDDFFSTDRFEKQLQQIKKGFMLISSNFQVVIDKETTAKPYYKREGEDYKDFFYQKTNFHHLDLKKELSRDHNILCHPSICYTKEFWQKYKYYDEQHFHFGRKEDLEMWKKVILKNDKIYLHPDILCYHRIHSNQVGRLK